MAYRWYCRVASVVFMLFTVYPLVTKLAEHRLHHDWLHVVLHLVSSLAAVYAGWFAASLVPARLFTIGIAAVYGVLGLVGWFIDGLLLSTPLAIPLGVVDNVFHLGLAVAAAAVIVVGERSVAVGVEPPPAT